MMMKRIKCVVVGDGSVGKTCLLMSYNADPFRDHIPLTFDSHPIRLRVRDDKSVYLVLYDTPGRSDYDALRKLIYPKTNWIQEIRNYKPTTPLILVVTKTDLRNSKDVLDKLASFSQKPISYDQGSRLAEELKAVAYVECSALKNENVYEVLQVVVNTALNSPKSSGCSIV